MPCQRCYGLLVAIHLIDVQATLECEALRCLNCGHIAFFSQYAAHEICPPAVRDIGIEEKPRKRHKYQRSGKYPVKPLF